MISGLLVFLILFRHILGPWALYRWLYAPSSSSLWKWKIQQKAPTVEKIQQDRHNSIFSIGVDVIVVGLIMMLEHTGYAKLDLSLPSVVDLSTLQFLYSTLIFGSLFILQDLYFYLTHSLLHHKRFFKFIHYVHHQSTNPTPWTSFSHHYVESFTELLFYPLILLILPINIYALLLYVFVTTLINFLGHCGFDFPALSLNRLPGLKWVATYTFHNQHHQYFQGNYSLYFNIWDRVFKTQVQIPNRKETHHEST